MVELQKEDLLFKKGLAMQREQFKSGKSGDGDNNFDMMCDAVENIKSEIKSKCAASDKGKNTIRRVEDIIDWYRSLEDKYARPTEEGYKVVFPRDINKRINKNLTIAFELLIEQMDNLRLL